MGRQPHWVGILLLISAYRDAGTATCAGFPGSLDTEALDASTFAAWGIDYLKYGELCTENISAAI